MTLEVPKTLFQTPDDLERHWSVSRSDLFQWMIGEELTAAVWLPVMSVVSLSETDALAKLDHWEGYIRISGPQCRRLYRHGWILLREFVSHDGKQTFRLPDAKDDIMVGIEDLVILESERRRFERRYPGVRKQSPQKRSSPPSTDSSSPASSSDFRVLRVAGRTYRFGTIQAKVLGLLAEAEKRGEPWQSGKALLREAGSQSFSVSNLFKRHPAWRNIIQSDGRGFYRWAL